MNPKDRRLEPRRGNLRPWDDQLRELFRSVEASVIRELEPLQCPRCGASAEQLGDTQSDVSWYRCARCEDFWAARNESNPPAEKTA
jgi:transposase-like protein